ncbi:MAG: SPOR domain-containing protein [Wenzhouxiangellaceae bacterium]|nr:SPOR domain-containing protein [Wenzhouxiangellaceae bacterium]
MARRQARRSSSSAGGRIGAFIAGAVFGLGLAGLAWLGGYLPGADSSIRSVPSGRDEPPIIDAPEPSASDQRFDFFTVLPEIEVVVPDREIEQRARDDAGADEPAASPGRGPYLIQAGSFRNAGDAEALKARLAMIGQVARVQSVSVDGASWHRVRLGPFANAREADQARRRLQDAGFDAMVLSENP